ncbi:aminotransferase class V-fold PLP-dependent enzyme [Sinimarinibacterium flocculans]|uniref:Selenocysteine lyase/cysteine desulfurase n=1 Tax=Sinimarinibacterium flocculans TaxID=985250 RepID=A0A318EIN4_9GAMM|nr:aminotransferase class V-fold PLP-dependent enzyme [Sinimarinibacterium flocculans]PXV71011.1 selenocysteine lyase/cysteine desulfurase [Sinimarinibacterium flocculans]
MSLKSHFARFLAHRPTRLHFCAHSHHPWPDVSFDAQQRAWLDAAELMDDKWTRIFGEIVPAAQHHLARLLNLPDHASLCFGANTHEFLTRLLSDIDARPLRVLTTDSEFLSFERQMRRLEEAGLAEVERVPVQPFDSFSERFGAAARAGGQHLVWFSHVFYNTGYWIEDLLPLVDAVSSTRSLVVVDGYHAFMAVPVDLGRIAARAFYLGGGYKYAMSGEGAAWMHCPPGYASRPLNTGWFAGFASLTDDGRGTVPYAEDGSRFWGATFDPTALYRLNAVMDWARRHQLSASVIRAHVLELQRDFLAALDRLYHPVLARARLQPPEPHPRGSFLTFSHPQAHVVQRRLHEAEVITDVRGDHLRIGFGLYHDRSDVDELLRRIARLPSLPA